MKALAKPNAKPARAAASTRRIYGGESPDERTARRRDQFIEAGRELFGTVGYRKTTVRSLCKQAELTDRYFYESFETTENLLVAVYERLITEMQTSLMNALKEADQNAGVDIRIAVGLDAFFRFAENPVASRIIWLEILSVSPRVDALYNSALRRFADILLALVPGTVPQWAFSEDVSKTVTLGLIGAVSELAKDWLMSGYEKPKATLVEGASVLFRAVAHLNGGSGGRD